MFGWSKCYGVFYLHLLINRMSWYLLVRLNSELSEFFLPQISRTGTHIVHKRYRLEEKLNRLTYKGKLHEIGFSVLLGD